MMEEKLALSLFDLRHSLCAPFLEALYYPWELLGDTAQLLFGISACLPADFKEIAPGVWVGGGTTIAATALVQGPAIIGRNCQIRHGAFIREFVLIGDGAVIGNSTEVKNAVLFDGVQAPHFNYIGDTILGYKAHLGAGAIVSNFKAAGDEIWATLPDGKRQNTGRNKFGALIGDHVEIGCNAVVFPGTIIGKEAVIYPLCPVRGYIPSGQILKNDGCLYPRSME
jgi:NDP-sugar pyrophosphorylase family protein